MYIPDQNLFPPFFGLCLAGEARPSGLGLNAGGGGVWDVVGVAGADGDVLGCAVRWGGGDVRRGGIGVGVSGVDTAAEGAMKDESDVMWESYLGLNGGNSRLAGDAVATESAGGPADDAGDCALV